MSGGTRTHYVLCYQIGNKKYYVPFYNSQQYFIKSKIVDGVTVQVKWFVSYVNGRRLYIPLHWPTISKSLITKISGRNYSFIRVYDNAQNFSPYVHLVFSRYTRWMQVNDIAQQITNYYIGLSLQQNPGYDWLCHVDIYTGTGEQQQKIFSFDYKEGVSFQQTYTVRVGNYDLFKETFKQIFVVMSFNFTQHTLEFSTDPNEYNEYDLYIDDLES